MVDYSNAYGAVGLGDGGTPRVITVKARANISGGWFVNGSSAQGVVSSGANSYSAGDIEAFNIATQIGSQCIGMALQDIPSGTYGPIAQRGLFICPALSGTAIGSIYSGQKICAGSAGTVLPLYSGLAMPNADYAAGFNSFDIGRALTEATNASLTQYCIVSLNL